MHPSALAGAFAAPAVKHNLGSVSGFTISLLRGWQRFSESARIPRMPPGCARLAGCGCWISPVLAQASGLAEGGQRKNVLRAASAGTPACRGPERIEQLAREGVLQGLVLRVPLHRSEEHTPEIHSLMRISYATFCLTKQ